MKYVTHMKMSDFDSWHRVNFPNIGGEKFGMSLIKWCDEFESNGCYSLGGHCVWFDDEKDAMMFVLRWYDKNK